MPQIDAILKFTSLAAALADPVVQQHVGDDQQQTFMSDHVIPNLQVWRDSQDVAGVHTYLLGYYALISLPRIVSALRDHPAVQVVINRADNTVVRRGTGIGLALLNDLRFSPIYAGCAYPWGAWS